ncbi:hypothetical protein SEPCBS57363_006096 [Sporothrix epigloea]|uniref:Histidine acid phosphatase n=1 Tax=Sporothrix epigloea TaxID=1892477 RepID=A0ABP0E2E4_9PEZI
MSDSVGPRWAVRAVVGISLFLAVHVPGVAAIPPPSDVNDGEKAAALQTSACNSGAPKEPEKSGSWYAPRSTYLNNLTTALSPSSKGVYGFLFNESTTPEGSYGVYNWCNMPHVRKTEYVVPPADKHRKLVYVELVHRHHKRTPYAANGFPHEKYPWHCDDALIHMYAKPSNELTSPGDSHYEPTYDNGNPFLKAALGWHGTCQFPQMTSGGLADAWQHGADLYEVYHGLLGFLPAMNSAAWRELVAFRITNNPITSQTATMVLGGMASAAGIPVASMPDTPLLLEADGYDSLEPQYSCSESDTLFDAITDSSAGGNSSAWADHLKELAPLFAKLDAASGVDPANPLGFHASVDHYYDNLSARQCHGLPPVAGITQDMADTVFRVGQWEYSRMYRDDARSLPASVGSFGVWAAQLTGHLRTARDMSEKREKNAVRYRHNVAHDGSVSRLLSILQVDEMVWPGMGSEVVVEMWQKEGTSSYDVRILFGGRVLRSSHPELGLLDMVPLNVLLKYIDGFVGADASLLPAKCNGTETL